MMSAAIPRLRGVYYGWVMLLTLSFTEVTSWGILYYAFAVFLKPPELLRSGIAACQAT